jgi:hypothetical protein
MTHRSPRTILAPLVAAALVAGLAAPAAAQVVRGRFVPCSSTSFGSIAPCGSDPLTFGQMSIAPGGGLPVVAQGVQPFNLYEVHWLPIGAAVGSGISLGSFGTDCNGDYNGPLRNITTGASVVGGPLTNFVTLVGSASAGNFLIYSRGPWGFNDADANCQPDTLNVVPLGGPPTNILANPAVVPGSTLVQFIPGYQ